MELIFDGNHFEALNYLFYFLAMWEERPVSLTLLAYQWCSAISEVAERLGLGVTDNTFYIHNNPQGPISRGFPNFRIPLEIAFRLVGPAYNEVRLNHTSHHDRIFEAAFSSDDDEVIADAACAWAVGYTRPTGSCARYFAKRVENPIPFSPRLRQVAIRAIENSWPTELIGSGSEVVRLLNRLDADVDDLHHEDRWRTLLVDVIRSPKGENLASHYWHLLSELVSTWPYSGSFQMRDVETMESFKEAGDWEKLEVWLLIVWGSLSRHPFEPEKEVGDATLKLLSLRPSALQSFKILAGLLPWGLSSRLTEVLHQARAERLCSEPQHLQYVSVRSSLFLSVLTSSFFLHSPLFPTESFDPLPFAGYDISSEY